MASFHPFPQGKKGKKREGGESVARNIHAVIIKFLQLYLLDKPIKYLKKKETEQSFGQKLKKKLNIT